MLIENSSKTVFLGLKKLEETLKIQQQNVTFWS
jgi:hypothetical protein